MSIPVIAFFNNKGGVGKTSLVFHVAHMLADQDFRVVAADMDPQGNLSAAFLSEQRLEELWPEDTSLPTIYGSVEPIKRGIGDIRDPLLERINDNLVLIPGDIRLSEFEDDLSEAWPRCLDRDERAFRVISAFWRVLQAGAEQHQADVIVIDTGPNLGAINRAALIATDYVVVPLAADQFSIHELRSLGPRLHTWQSEWTERRKNNPDTALPMPRGQMTPIGYVVTMLMTFRNRSSRITQRWAERIPAAYRRFVLNDPGEGERLADDTNCLAMLKHYRSLMPMAQEAGKPIFQLKPGDGALGAHVAAVRDAYKDFKTLSLEIVSRAGISK